MIGFAVVFGLLAVFVAQAWLNSQAEMRAKNLEAQKKPAMTQTIVVAAKPPRFGSELGAMSLREVAWPHEAVPAGAFRKISELTSNRRVVLTAIEANEPILASKNHRLRPTRNALGNDRRWNEGRDHPGE